MNYDTGNDNVNFRRSRRATCANAAALFRDADRVHDARQHKHGHRGHD